MSVEGQGRLSSSGRWYGRSALGFGNAVCSQAVTLGAICGPRLNRATGVTPGIHLIRDLGMAVYRPVRRPDSPRRVLRALEAFYSAYRRPPRRRDRNAGPGRRRNRGARGRRRDGEMAAQRSSRLQSGRQPRRRRRHQARRTRIARTQGPAGPMGPIIGEPLGGWRSRRRLPTRAPRAGAGGKASGEMTASGQRLVL